MVVPIVTFRRIGSANFKASSAVCGDHEVWNEVSAMAKRVTRRVHGCVCFRPDTISAGGFDSSVYE